MMTPDLLTPDLLTIGYEGTVLAEVIDLLHGAGVTHLIDVRAVPQSRKPGFSKKLVGGSREAGGIRYAHLRGLGTPKPGRDAARRGDVAAMHAIFNAHMRTHEAQTDLAHAIAISLEARACLLCFEADHNHCHRSIVAALICDRTGQAGRHLPVRPAVRA